MSACFVDNVPSDQGQCLLTIGGLIIMCGLNNKHRLKGHGNKTLSYFMEVLLGLSIIHIWSMKRKLIYSYSHSMNYAKLKKKKHLQDEYESTALCSRWCITAAHITAPKNNVVILLSFPLFLVHEAYRVFVL